MRKPLAIQKCYGRRTDGPTVPFPQLKTHSRFKNVTDRRTDGPTDRRTDRHGKVQSRVSATKSHDYCLQQATELTRPDLELRYRMFVRSSAERASQNQNFSRVIFSKTRFEDELKRVFTFRTTLSAQCWKQWSRTRLQLRVSERKGCQKP